MIGPIGLKKELVRLVHSSKLEVEAFGSGQMDERADQVQDAGLGALVAPWPASAHSTECPACLLSPGSW